VAEAEWLAAADPGGMLAAPDGGVGERQVRLFACACCRRIVDLPDVAARALDVIERYADNAAGEPEMDAARAAVGEADRATGYSCRAYTPVLYASIPRTAGLTERDLRWYMVGVGVDLATEAAAEGLLRRTGVAPPFEEGAVEPVKAAERCAQARLIRDLIGNPFRCAPAVDATWLAWSGGTVVRIARAAYESRPLPGGVLDAPRLALLADALEDAGCADAELLGHLRGPGPHVRGCRAVDLILGKK
jgi:hypothetical protein